MSNVGKAGAATAPSPGAVRPEAGERAAKPGAFEAVLRDRGHAPGAGGSDGATGSRSASRLEERGEGGDAREWRALPGDVAVPALAPTGSAAAVEGSRAADAVAMIERIAEQIVRAVEVRLGHGGSAEVRLELDLGGLGQLRVALHRDAAGTLAVRFDAAGTEASRLLVDQGGDLVARLEARGLALREVVMTGAHGSLVRIGTPAEAASPEIASRLAANAARSREQALSRPPDERGRRRRGTARPDEEEE
jgi:hypothetical protein